MNHVLLDYRRLETVFDYLLDLILRDSQINSNLEVNLSENTAVEGTQITIAIKGEGYGLPLNVLDADEQDDPNRMINECKDFAIDHGGEFQFTTQAGQGMQFNLSFPVQRSLH